MPSLSLSLFGGVSVSCEKKNNPLCLFVLGVDKCPVLKNDLKAIMEQIEQALHKYHECIAAERAQ